MNEKGCNVYLTKASPIENLRANRYETGVAATALIFAIIHAFNHDLLDNSVFGVDINPWDDVRSVVYAIASLAVLVGIAVDHNKIFKQKLPGTAIEGWGLTALVAAWIANMVLVIDLMGFRPGLIPVLFGYVLPSVDRLLSLASRDRLMIPVAISGRRRDRLKRARS